MHTRDARLIDENGRYIAEFNRFIQGRVKRVKYNITPHEAQALKWALNTGNEAAIDIICYSIS